MEGLIFDIQRGCIHDGPGIRTTVFFKGCNLYCRWCHNPESFLMKRQLQYQSARCLGCGKCAGVCPEAVHSFENGRHAVDFDKCLACGKCVEICPAEALSILGRRCNADTVMDEVLKDVDFYTASGGGVTFSGGEPTLQMDFLCELAQRCRSAHIHTAIESNGMWREGIAQKLFSCIDLILLDYKLAGDDDHRQYTGGVSRKWLRSLNAAEEADKPVWLRCPLIPGINDNEAFITAAAGLYREYRCIRHIELMPYHTIGVSKWESLGLDYELAGLPAMPREEKQRWDTRLQQLCGTWRDGYCAV